MEVIQTITTNPDLSPIDKLILCYLNTSGVDEIDTTIKDLSYEIGVRQNTLYQNIYHLQENGYLVFDKIYGKGIILSNYET